MPREESWRYRRMKRVTEKSVNLVMDVYEGASAMVNSSMNLHYHHYEYHHVSPLQFSLTLTHSPFSLVSPRHFSQPLFFISYLIICFRRSYYREASDIWYKRTCLDRRPHERIGQICSKRKLIGLLL